MNLSIKNEALFSGSSNMFSTSSSNNTANSIFSSNGISDMSSLIGEYNSIKNGSYAKLAKQYYGKDTKNSTASDAIKDSLNTVEGSVKNKTEIAQNKELISDVSSLRKSISSITNDDTLFTKVDKKNESGETVSDYNYDKINSKISEFVKQYNETVEAGAESDNSTVLRNVLNMTNTTENYKQQLSQAGISINSDNTLSYDADALKTSINTDAKASGSKSVFTGIEAVNNLFGKNSNYMKQIDTMATNVASQAASDVYSLGGYTSTGAYKQTLESIYNTTI